MLRKKLPSIRHLISTNFQCLSSLRCSNFFLFKYFTASTWELFAMLRIVSCKIIYLYNLQWRNLQGLNPSYCCCCCCCWSSHCFPLFPVLLFSLQWTHLMLGWVLRQTYTKNSLALSTVAAVKCCSGWWHKTTRTASPDAPLDTKPFLPVMSFESVKLSDCIGLQVHCSRT